uniref:Ionotropic glutamate receptor C-terminal domain-containing protein n=1 Tax=Trichogramma kaykai TaxID=54128 RepID=A0ABD2W3Z9_9HYME
MLGNWKSSEISVLSSSYSTLFIFDMTGFNNILIPTRYRRLKNVFKINETVLEKASYPARIVIIEETSNNKFREILTSLRNSIFWDNQASFLVVTKISVASCLIMATSVLNLAWSFDIVNIFFLCVTSTNHHVLYTFNPFISIATSFWEIEVNSKINTTNGTLFSCDITELFEHEDMCYFNKLRNLSGYKMLVGAELTNFSRKSNVKLEEIPIVSAKLIRKFVEYTQVNYNMTIYPALPPLDYDGKPQGAIQDLINGTIDICTRSSVIEDRWRMQSGFATYVYVHAISRKFKVSLFRKFISAIDPNIFVNIGASFIMFLLVSTFILKLSWTTSFFEYLRMFTSSMDQRAFKRAYYSSEKILMCTTILLISYSSAYFVGLFSAVNTLTDFESDIDSIDDFINDTKVKLYVYTSHVPQITAITKQHIVAFVDLIGCIKEMFHQDNVICIVGTLVINGYGIRESELIHISKPLFDMRTSVFSLRPDWVLLPKLNDFLLRFYEAGFTQKLFGSYKIYWDASEKRDWSMKIEEMFLVFSVLLAGHALAIFVLNLELMNRANRKHNESLALSLK